MEEIVKSRIEEHVFHYSTHSVVWTVFYGPRQPEMAFELPCPDESMGLQVWCRFHLTRESAERALERESDRFFDVETNFEFEEAGNTLGG